tara:strand:+ start:980 stop:1960 length:981 start_codon:yes stop_codon:yes gene_type:complete
MTTTTILVGDCLQRLRELPNESVHCAITSPPYWGLRDYGVDAQIGLEPTPDEYVAQLVAVFREVRRVLRDDGTLWLNIGDSYAGSWGNQGRKQERGTQRPINGEMLSKVHDNRYPSQGSNTGKIPEGSGLKPKDLIGIPWRVAFALQADGWYLRQDIIWSKPNPMPESVTDRCTKAHEYIFLLSKSLRYYYDAEAIAEEAAFPNGPNGKVRSPFGQGFAAGRSDGTTTGVRNKRSVWTVTTKPFSGAHFATFPPDLIEPCIKAGCPKDGTVLDPFGGAGTTGMVADRLGRDAIIIELNADYAEMARRRIENDGGMWSTVKVVAGAR